MQGSLRKCSNLVQKMVSGSRLDTSDSLVVVVAGNLCMITGGRNLGRVGTVTHRERHPGSFDIVHVKDSQGHTFATRYAHTFVDA